MGTMAPPLDVFRHLPLDDQLTVLVNCGRLVGKPRSPAVTYYRVENYYVRVTVALSPLRVLTVEPFDEGRPYQAMLAEARV